MKTVITLGLVLSISSIANATRITEPASSSIYNLLSSEGETVQIIPGGSHGRNVTQTTRQGDGIGIVSCVRYEVPEIPAAPAEQYTVCLLVEE